MRRLFIALLLVIGAAAGASAQTVSGDRFRFNTGPCYLRSGSGSPEAAVTGSPCDTYWRTDTASLYLKTSGSGTNTGWTLFASSSSLSGSGTATRIAGWSTTSVLEATGLVYSGANITTGVWQGTPVVTTYGGTGLSAWTAGDVPYYASGAALSKLGIGTTRQILQTNAGATAPEWTSDLLTSTTIGAAYIYRASGTDVAVADGGTNISSYAIGDLLYASGATDLSKLADVAVGSYLRSGGVATAPLWSTLKLPNAATQYRVVFASDTNTYGEDADLTFNTDTLSATNLTVATNLKNTALTATRVVFAGAAGLLVDDADLTFATDTLTATKALMPTYAATPSLYAYGATKSLSLGGTGVSGCSIADPAVGGTANCEAASFTLTSAFLEQRLTTNTAVRSQWYVQDAQDDVPPFANFTAYNNSGWMGMRFFGAPVTIAGGGFHVGQNAVADPGLGNMLVDGYIRSTSPVYASQTTGMAVDFTDGSIDARYLYVDEMHAKKFIADLEQALAGGQIISKSVGMIGAAFTVPAKGSISVLTMKDLPSAEDMAIFESGDWVRIRTFSRAAGSLSITDAWGIVTSYTNLSDGLQSWNFQRALGDEGGAMSADTVIPVDSLVLDYGVSGNGFHEVNAIDGLYGVNSPYSQIVTWSGASPRSANQTVRTRMGNLKGITGSLEYGLLAGTYGSTSSGQYVIFSDTRAEIHNVPLSLYNGANQTLYLSPTYSSFGQATSGASALTYSSGVGCWSGVDSGVFKWRCGDMAGQFIAWNGTTLNVNGNITVTGLIAADTLAVDGTPAADVSSGAARGLLGLTADGNPSLPDTATPSGSGLFLGSDYMGYYTGGAWTSYIRSNGTWRFSGDGSNYIQWDGATLDLKGSITITGGSGYDALEDKPTLGAMAAKDVIALGDDTSGNYAGSASEGGAASDTALVDGTAAATVKGGAVKANAGLDASGNVIRAVTSSFLPVAGSSVLATGLNLTADYLGYYDGAAWKTFMDSSGNFYLGGTGGNLQWVAGTSTLTITGIINVVAGGNAATQSYAESEADAAEAAAAADATSKANAAQAAAEATASADATAKANAAAAASLPLHGTADAAALTGRVVASAAAAPSGAGLYLGSDYLGYYSGAAWKTYMTNTGTFYLSGTGANALSWDGTTLAINGALTSVSGTIGGFTLAANQLSSGTDADFVALNSGGTNALWIGDATFADAEFSVTSAGALKATSATITGTVTAIAGAIGGFTLAANTLSSGTDADYVAMSSGGTNAFWAGDSTFADAEFSVTAAGVLKATSATLTGTLSAASGNVTINGDGLALSSGTAWPPSDSKNQIRFLQGASEFATLSASRVTAGIHYYDSVGLLLTGSYSAGSLVIGSDDITSSTTATLTAGGTYGTIALAAPVVTLSGRISSYLRLGTATDNKSLAIRDAVDGQITQHFTGNVASSFLAFYAGATGDTIQGSITHDNAGSVALNSLSDQRLKTDLGLATTTRLADVKIHDFVWKRTGTPGRGVFAQEAIEIFPRMVLIGEDELDVDGLPVVPWMANHASLIPELVVGWQQHDRDVTDLKQRIAHLEALVTALMEGRK